MKLKGIDIFCASQASTAICFSMDQASSSSSIQLGGRAIDRHNPIIQDARRSSSSSSNTPRFINPPCYSQPPINPKTYHQLQKSKKSSSNLSKKNIVSFTKKKYEQKRKSTSSSSSSSSKSKEISDDNVKKSSLVQSGSLVRKSSVEKVDLISTTPPGSSRYLLSEKVFFDGVSDYEPVSALVPVEGDKENQNTVMNKQENECAISSARSFSSLSKPPPPSNQVVVLRVSLHCKGCEGKLRKHLSRMQGVSSFNIDFAAKKVTVMGDVTPVSVLASVSKVKNAQFWPTVSSTP